MPKYRLHDAEGNDLGEMRLGDVPFRPCDEIFLGPSKKLRVLDVVPVEEEDSPYVGLLQVEARRDEDARHYSPRSGFGLAGLRGQGSKSSVV